MATKATASYQPGQILTADELNASLNAKTDNANANITGGQIGGLISLNVSGTLPSTIPANGALTVAGGAGVGGNINAGGYIAAPTVNANGNANSSSPTTGALVVTGGAGVGGNIFAGGSISSAANVNGNGLAATGNTPSTSTTTGALVVTGGGGIGGALNVGGAINAASIKVTGGATISGGINIDTITAQTSISAPQVNVTGVTPSTSPTTGALIVAGGVGIGGNLNAAGALMGVNNGNLLVNGTGEFGDTDWTFPGASASFPGILNPTTGNAVFMNAVALSAAATDTSAAIPIGPNQTVTLSADLSAQSVTAGTLTVTLIAQNASGGSLGTVCSVSATNGQPVKTFTASGTTPANTAQLVLTKALTGASVAAPINGAFFRRMKVENGAGATLYSQEGSMKYVQTLATNLANNAAITYAIALG